VVFVHEIQGRSLHSRLLALFWPWSSLLFFLSSFSFLCAPASPPPLPLEKKMSPSSFCPSHRPGRKRERWELCPNLSPRGEEWAMWPWRTLTRVHPFGHVPAARETESGKLEPFQRLPAQRPPRHDVEWTQRPWSGRSPEGCCFGSVLVNSRSGDLN